MNATNDNFKELDALVSLLASPRINERFARACAAFEPINERLQKDLKAAKLQSFDPNF